VDIRFNARDNGCYLYSGGGGGCTKYSAESFEMHAGIYIDIYISIYIYIYIYIEYTYLYIYLYIYI